MFTGIIEATSTVKKIKKNTGGLILELAKPKKWKVSAGESIAIDGICSTLKSQGPALVFDYMPESVLLTTLSAITTGDIVNVERSLKLSDRLSGHIVTGHVDTTGIIGSIRNEGISRIFLINISDKKLLKLIARKGSVALNGISLTVSNVNRNSFEVKIIPYTWENTNLKFQKVGDKLNIEFDILAKYVEMSLRGRRSGRGNPIVKEKG